MTHILREGEVFTEGCRLRGGFSYTVSTEGWEGINALSIRLTDDNNVALVPEVDEQPDLICFTPPRSGIYGLTVVLETIAEGRVSAEVGATIVQIGEPYRSEDKGIKKVG